MASSNDITGDTIRTKAPNDKYSLGWDAIFNQKIPMNERARIKDRVDLGLSPSCIIEEFTVKDNKL
jgi:hypothetical protein|tara:strand:- start:47 stop:244 length:198 start_codon:yes stop_codon:yes gene_type:complete